MKITKLQTCDFQGLRGKREYNFGTETVYALCQKNGSGKTSFLNAFRYVLSGNKQGSILSSGAAMSAVGMTLDDGTSVIRQEFAEKSPKYYVNSGSTSKKVMEEQILSHTGVPGSVMKVVTSSEILEKMNPQEFGELLLSYIPEQLSAEKVLGYLGDVPAGVKEYLSINLPDGDFGMEEVDAIYKTSFDTRREVKKRLAVTEAAVRTPVEKTEKSAEEYRKEQERLQEVQKETIQKIKEKALFEKVKKYREEQTALVLQLRKRILALAVPDKLPDREQISADLSAKQEKLKNSSSVLGTLRQNLAVLEKSLETIDKPVCPLSEKLVCTTDKSVVKKEISSAVYETKQALKMQEMNVEAETGGVRELQRQLKSANDVILRAREAETLTSQIRQIEENLPELPENPGVVEDSDKLIEEMNGLINLQKRAEEYERYSKALTAHKALQEQLETLEYVVNAFSPKGIIRQSVADYYIGTFEEECNRKAGKLQKNFRIRFENGSGIEIKADTGDGTFRGYASLSGGEKIFVLYLVMDMLSSLTGLGILIFDELSILDREAFASLLSLIRETESDYDMIFLSAAEHGDIQEALEQSGVKMIEV